MNSELFSSLAGWRFHSDPTVRLAAREQALRHAPAKLKQRLEADKRRHQPLATAASVRKFITELEAAGIDGWAFLSAALSVDAPDYESLDALVECALSMRPSVEVFAVLRQQSALSLRLKKTFPEGARALAALTELRLMANKPLTDTRHLAELGEIAGPLELHFSTTGFGLDALAPLASRLTGLVIDSGGTGAKDCSDNRLTDLGPLSGFTALRRLKLNGSRAIDLSPLRGLALTDLDLGDSHASSLEALRGMKSLRLLALVSQTGQVDVSAVATLTALEHLQLNHCGLEKLSLLKSLGSLKYLDLENNEIGDLAPLAALPLEVLRLRLSESPSSKPLFKISTLVAVYGIDDAKLDAHLEQRALALTVKAP